MDLDTPKYKNREAAWAADVSVETLQTWANRGLIASHQAVPGQGRRRLYSLRGLIAIAIAARAVDLGISASLASDISRGLLTAPDIQRLEEVPALVLAGKGPGYLKFQYAPDFKALSEILERKSFVSDVAVLVCVRDIAEGVLSKLERLGDAKDCDMT